MDKSTGGDGHPSTQISIFEGVPPHLRAASDVTELLKTDVREGLTREEASSRLHTYGRNELESESGVSWYTILIRQVANAMIIVLLAAMAVSFGVHSWIEGGFILVVILLNVVVGFVQELKAERHMDSLRSLASANANVCRGGSSTEIDATELVPGDIVYLRTGDTVPADLRIIESVNLETDEALLTGESLPVTKVVEAEYDSDDVPVGDRINLAYSSSNVTKGRATGVVVFTGMHTEIGAIAHAMRQQNNSKRQLERNEDGSLKWFSYPKFWAMTALEKFGNILGVNVGTPLHRKLAWLAIFLLACAIIAAIIVFAVSDFSGAKPVVVYATATAISLIPASLLAVLTITMAAGAKNMLRCNVIVRKLDALEALGAVTDICSDKTGTLTQGKMVTKAAWVAGYGTFAVGDSSDPFDPTNAGIAFEAADATVVVPKPYGTLSEKTDSNDTERLVTPEFEEYLKPAAMANLAKVFHSQEEGWRATGDPTEIAIQVFVHRLKRSREYYTGNNSEQSGSEKSGSGGDWVQLAEYPFDSDVKRMSVLFRHVPTGKIYAFMKGAVERITEACDSFGLEMAQMDDEKRDYIVKNMEVIASKGLRCLAIASCEYRGGDFDPSHPPPRKQVEKGLNFKGLIGLYDPPRLESAPAVAKCKSAGIAVHMLTGDHPGTARSIAQDIGILPRNMDSISKEMESQLIMTATQFDKLSDEEIDNRKFLPAVIARCAPQTKVRMIEALHRRKKFVAMTGDGVNDSPSLKRSDIGIAMGKAGSDVAKDASDLVLTDDNFASITSAVEEGRRMFDNIKKFVLHLLAGNVAQALYLLIGLVFKDRNGRSVFPISPIEILWIIMVCQSFPAMGLGFEYAAPDAMKRPPHNIKHGVFTIEVVLDMFVYGLIMAILCIAGFVAVIYGYNDGELGVNCNESHSAICMPVFRARSTTFSQLTVYLLFLAWQLIDFRHSIFYLDESKGPFQVFGLVWRNKMLFFSIWVGFVSIFPVIYIPVINKIVFKHAPISWEWAIVFVSIFIFLCVAELWKYTKRVAIRRFNLDPPPDKSGDWWTHEATRSTRTLSFAKFASFARSERSRSSLV